MRCEVYLRGEIRQGAMGWRHQPILALLCATHPLDAAPVKPEKALDAVADKVLTYRPKPKSSPAKRRKRRKAKLAKKPR